MVKTEIFVHEFVKIDETSVHHGSRGAMIKLDLTTSMRWGQLRRFARRSLTPCGSSGYQEEVSLLVYVDPTPEGWTTQMHCDRAYDVTSLGMTVSHCIDFSVSSHDFDGSMEEAEAQMDPKDFRIVSYVRDDIVPGLECSPQ